MKLKAEDVTLLMAALNVCKTLGIEAVVVDEGMIRGCTPSMRIAILTKTAITFPEDETPGKIRLGLGRISELDKRLSIFSGQVEVDCKLNDAGTDISMLTMSCGKTKLQFRCTKATLIKYPKGNDDTSQVIVTLTKAEALQLARALTSLGAETAVLKVDHKGQVGFEAIDPTNDKFSMDLETAADFVDEHLNVVQSYQADKFAVILAAAAKDAETVSLIVGEFGSITTQLRGHTILVMPHVTGEEDDE